MTLKLRLDIKDNEGKLLFTNDPRVARAKAFEIKKAQEKAAKAKAEADKKKKETPESKDVVTQPKDDPGTGEENKPNGPEENKEHEKAKEVISNG